VCCAQELHFDDDAEHGPAAAFEHHDLIGMVASRGGILDGELVHHDPRVRRELEVEHVAQKRE
jgi:hypothetical protein